MQIKVQQRLHEQLEVNNIPEHIQNDPRASQVIQNTLFS